MEDSRRFLPAPSPTVPGEVAAQPSDEITFEVQEVDDQDISSYLTGQALHGVEGQNAYSPSAVQSGLLPRLFLDPQSAGEPPSLLDIPDAGETFFSHPYNDELHRWTPSFGPLSPVTPSLLSPGWRSNAGSDTSSPNVSPSSSDLQLPSPITPEGEFSATAFFNRSPNLYNRSPNIPGLSFESLNLDEDVFRGRPMERKTRPRHPSAATSIEGLDDDFHGLKSFPVHEDEPNPDYNHNLIPLTPQYAKTQSQDLAAESSWSVRDVLSSQQVVSPDLLSPYHFLQSHGFPVRSSSANHQIRSSSFENSNSSNSGRRADGVGSSLTVDAGRPRSNSHNNAYRPYPQSPVHSQGGDHGHTEQRSRSRRPQASLSHGTRVDVTADWNVSNRDVLPGRRDLLLTTHSPSSHEFPCYPRDRSASGSGWPQDGLDIQSGLVLSDDQAEQVSKPVVATPATRAAAGSRRKNPGAFICGICGDDFTAKHNLQNHIRSHKKERPFSCEGCGQRFGTGHVLKRHSRKCSEKRSD